MEGIVGYGTNLESHIKMDFSVINVFADDNCYFMNIFGNFEDYFWAACGVFVRRAAYVIFCVTSGILQDPNAGSFRGLY